MLQTGYSINKSGFGYIVNPNLDSVRKSAFYTKSESGFGEYCLNAISLAM